MANIAFANEVHLGKASLVVAYNERGSFLFARAGKLVAFTNNTVSIRRGTNDPIVVTLDARGGFLATRLGGALESASGKVGYRY
jgi:hypothetical protein